MKINSFVIIIVIFIIPITAISGDYELFIFAGTNRICNGREVFTQDGGCHEDAWRPVCKVEEVIQDLKGYFSGNDPQIKILVPAFGNGHVTFCDEEVRLEVYSALRKIRASGSNKRGRHLEDFISVNKL
jgi:hypothetical protein